MGDQATTLFDALVVGSGASGGWAAKRLSEAGLKVALVDAGRPQSDKNFTEHQPAFELKYRNRAPEIIPKTWAIQVKFGVCNGYTYKWFLNHLAEPYTTQTDKPFDSIANDRMTIERTKVWHR